MKKMRLITALSLVPLLILSAGTVNAQDFTHPSDMRLPESNYQRPDPTDYQLTLENGLIAYVARAGQVPLVTLSAFIRVGTVDDKRQGTAEALLDALRNSGPEKLSPDEFKTELTRMTAAYRVDMHDEWTEISLNVPSEDLPQALTLFAGLIQAPAISATNIHGAALGAMPATRDDLAGEDGPALYEGSLKAAVERFYEVLYTDHPYGFKPSIADFAERSVDDVEAFHAAYFVPENVTIAVAGDIDVDSISATIIELFGDWQNGDVPPTAKVPAVRIAKSDQHNFPANKLQSWLVFGHDLPQVPVADQAALEIMNYILAGGHLWTRMTVETRYKYGYTNDASGFMEDKWFGPGGYSFRSYSRPDVIKAIYDNMMDEIVRIRNEPVSDEEMFVAKGALTDGSFQIQYLDGYSISRSFALERLRYGNHDLSASYLRRIRAVTADDIIEAARKYLRPDEMQIILVGKPQDLLENRNGDSRQ